MEIISVTSSSSVFKKNFYKFDKAIFTLLFCIELNENKTKQNESKILPQTKIYFLAQIIKISKFGYVSHKVVVAIA